MNRLGQHAIVIGGSIAGLMTARVLADFFDSVTVLDRDQISAEPAIHKSIPQGNHLHLLLLGGQQVMSQLYPNFTDSLQQLGAVRLRAGKDMACFFHNRKAYSLTGSIRQPHDLGFDFYCQSRGLLEYCVRQATLTHSNVKIRTECPVAGLIWEGGRVQGVGVTQDGERSSLEADLVVDAGGRGSRAPRWLKEMEFQVPGETAIGVDFAYSSAQLRIPAYAGEPERMLLFLGPAPHYWTGAAFEAIENDCWHLSLFGRFGDYPPADREGFLAFAQEAVPSRKLYQIIKDAEFVTDIVPHRFPSSVQRHYERLAAFPERFVVLGDAVSSFNPVYGQGMSSAALQVEALRELLTRAGGWRRWPGRVGRGFFHQSGGGNFHPMDAGRRFRLLLSADHRRTARECRRRRALFRGARRARNRGSGSEPAHSQGVPTRAAAVRPFQRAAAEPGAGTDDEIGLSSIAPKTRDRCERQRNPSEYFAGIECLMWVASKSLGSHPSTAL